MTHRHRELLGLQIAQSLSELRSQFNRSALDLGFLGLAERAQPRSTRNSGDHSTPHFPWSNSVEFYGTRTPDYIDALTQAFDTADPLEVIIRRRWEKQRRAPFLLSQQPRAFDDNKAWLHLRVDFGEPAYRDALVVPIPAPADESRHLYFMSCEPITPERFARGLLLGSVYGLKVQLLDRARQSAATAGTASGAVELTREELEVIRWSVAGKTLQEISAITGLGYRTVRYRLDRARNRYGYATLQQTLVRAAKDYELDPLGR